MSALDPPSAQGEVTTSYNLFYLARPIYGGWVSFTAHLSLKHSLPIHKLSTKTEKRLRPFGYGTYYKNVSSILPNPIIVAVDRNHYKYLSHFPDDTWIVIHDTSEITKSIFLPQLLQHLRRFRIITIRKSVQQFLQDTYNLSSLFIIHPFYPVLVPPSTQGGEKTTTSALAPPSAQGGAKATRAISISRIDYDKHTDILLKANQHLPNTHQITLHGFANTQYVYNKLKALPFAEFYEGTFPKTFDALSTILKDAKYCIDMSIIQNDGGGTQYSFLEAIYHGVALVLHKRWLRSDTLFIPNENCFAVDNEKELVELLTRNPDTSEIIKCSRGILEPHITVDWIEQLKI